MIVLGARPQFIKSAPIIHELLKRRAIALQIVNSGQHYDYELSQIFFDQLKLPPPALNLQVGSGSHAIQTAKAMTRIEQAILKLKPDLVLVPGDTNTTLAAALAAAKLNVPVGHIEAGARSFDMTMPEEINRRVTDHVSAVLFAPTKTTERNLRNEGIPAGRIFQVGDTIVDAVRTVLPRARKSQEALFEKIDLRERDFVLMTAHRPDNVDNPQRLRSIVNALSQISKNMRVIFPAHPRVMHNLKSRGLMRRLHFFPNITLIKPVGYVEMIALLDAASAILTDSGGLQKEAYLLGVACTTMRNSTEWPETLKARANRLVDADPEEIIHNVLDSRNAGPRMRLYDNNPFSRGGASKRIVDIISSNDEWLQEVRGIFRP